MGSDLCLTLFDNTVREKKSPVTVFPWNLIYNHNSSMIINLNLRSGREGRVNIKQNLGRKSCPLRYGELRPLRGVWASGEKAERTRKNSNDMRTQCRKRSVTRVLDGRGSCPGGRERGFLHFKRLTVFHSQISESSRKSLSYYENFANLI